MGKQIREVRKIDIFIYFYLSLILLAGIWIGFVIGLKNGFSINNALGICVLVLISILSLYLFKNFLIGLILYYKALAPMRIREQCRFEPTCSTYMILCLRKYGILVGIIKGTIRIFRCKPPNGGYDYPRLFKDITEKPEEKEYGE